MPSLELRHEHTGGSDPHHHHRIERTGPDEIVAQHHHHDHHPHLDHVHQHEHPSSVHSQNESPITDDPAIPASNDASGHTDWHTHISWIGWLLGDQLEGASSDEISTVSHPSASLAICPPGVSEPFRMKLVTTYLTYIHGPPPWIFGQVLRHSHKFSHAHELPPPLCDIARHERSGVQLI